MIEFIFNLIYYISLLSTPDWWPLHLRHWTADLQYAIFLDVHPTRSSCYFCRLVIQLKTPLYPIYSGKICPKS